MSLSVPIIRIEIESMLNTYSVQMDEQVKLAIDKYCTPENLQAIISWEVKTTLDECIKAEVKNFFSYGSEGKKIVAEAVRKKLLEGIDYD